MKLIAVDRFADGLVPEIQRALECDEVPAPDVLPAVVATDSACTRLGQPLFVPDFARDWVLEICPCLYIGRLGKSMSEKFVERHIDGYGLMVWLHAPQPHMSAGASANFDGAFSPGVKFQGAHPQQWSIAFEAVDANVPEGMPKPMYTGSADLTRDDVRVEAVTALLSRWMMLKTGDIIVPVRSRLLCPATIGLNIRITLNGADAINLHVR